jgi:hypothetical protein
MDASSHDDGGDGSSPAPVSLPWIEPGYREFKDIFATGAVALLLLASLVGLVRAAVGTPGNQLGGALLALTMAVVAALIWYGPTGWVGARITVDHDGLWVRHWGWQIGSRRIELSPAKHLPARQIGRAEIVKEDARSRIWRRSMSLQYRGRLLGWTRTNVGRDTTEAVLIEQTGAGLDRPWWLLRCQACPELIEALDLARRAAEADHGSP